MQDVMRYEKVCKGTFLDRPNRFVAHVMIEGRKETVHVKNTGRCKELLVPGAEVYLEDFTERMGTRKLKYSLIAVRKEGKLINMDSQAPNRVVEEALEDGTIALPGMAKLTLIQREKTYGESRFDFYLEDCQGEKAWLEVKGVTLEDRGIVRFPDAPTERGVKHINQLIKAVKEGYKGYILFVVQMGDVRVFEPNDETHKAFGDKLREAEACNVKVLAYQCNVAPDALSVEKKVEKINLKNLKNSVDTH